MIPEQAQPTPTTPPIESTGIQSRLLVDLAVLATGLILFSFLARQVAPFIPDDSFISFRYADHLAQGHGLRFNIGEPPVEAYSNFLWVVLLAVPARLGLDLETASMVLGGILGSACLIVLWWLLVRRDIGGIQLAVPVILLAVSGPFVLYSISGMETPLFALLLLGLVVCLDFLLVRPTIVRGLALALVGFAAALTRPEGVIAFPVIFACWLIFDRKYRRSDRPAVIPVALVALLSFGALLLTYHIIRVSYFGAFWPTPFLSKGVADRSIIDVWLVNLKQFFIRQSNYYAPMVYYYLAIALPAILGVILTAGQNRRRPVEWSAFVLAVIYAGFYVSFVDWMPGMRYYVPLVGLFLIPLSLLGPELRLPPIRPGDWRRDLPFLTIGLTLVIVSLFSLAVLRLNSAQLHDGTQESLVKLGHWLRENMPAEATLAISDAGATPYYSRLTSIDINPASLTDRTIAENGWSSDYFFAVDPDVVILTAFSLTEPDFYWQHEELYGMPRFQETYHRIGVVKNDWYQDRSYWVFVRRDLTPTADQMATFPPGIRKQ